MSVGVRRWAAVCCLPLMLLMSRCGTEAPNPFEPNDGGGAPILKFLNPEYHYSFEYPAAYILKDDNLQIVAVLSAEEGRISSSYFLGSRLDKPFTDDQAFLGFLKKSIPGDWLPFKNPLGTQGFYQHLEYRPEPPSDDGDRLTAIDATAVAPVVPLGTNPDVAATEAGEADDRKADDAQLYPVEADVYLFGFTKHDVLLLASVVIQRIDEHKANINHILNSFQFEFPEPNAVATDAVGVATDATK